MDIHLGHVVTPQDATSTNISPSTPDLLDIPDAAVVVDGSIIAAVGEASDILDAYSSTTAATVHDHGDALIIPGLVDCHVHYPQIGMIASPGEQLLDWLDRYTFPAEARFADKAHAEATAEFFTDQLIRNGVTTALVFSTVHPHSVDALFTAAQRKDLRIITGKMCMDRNAPADLLDTPESAVADSKALIDRWHGTGRLEYAITPRFAPTSSDAQLRALGELAADHPDVLIQTHLSENTAECDWVRELFPQASDYTDVYDRAGLVRERAVFGHAVHLSDRELTRLDEAHASLAHCPTSNNFLGSGLFPLKDILGKVPDLRIGFGSDVGAGTSLSPLATAGEAYKVSRLLASAASTSGTTALTAAELLYHSTLGGARALGVDAHVGSLAPGKDADLVILDPTAATTASGTPADPVLAHRAAQCTTTGELLFACLMLGDDRTVAGVVVNGTLVGTPGAGMATMAP
ncbi:guanine deaminase [Corynebacterium variabile]|uniref:guanine deaminase n=2 Tax=Corynebacterium variabile TaxID=1727 RepID=UPI001D6023C5|nr:guanine deaminase [Corynebacterium variabile]HJG46894.1 guanine deaminase [Corynebacterium variabile]